MFSPFSLSVLFAMISKNLVAVENPGRKENLSFSLSPGGGAVTVRLALCEAGRLRSHADGFSSGLIQSFFESVD